MLLTFGRGFDLPLPLNKMNIWNKFLSKHCRKKGYKKEYLKLRVAEYNKDLLKGFTILILLLVGVGVVMYLPYFDMKSKSSNIYFRSISNIYENNDIVISIAEVCGNFEEEEKQIRCVNNFVREFFYYDEHKGDKKLFRTPVEIINIGGCCRDWSIFYCAIFSVMGYESEFIQTQTHIYLRVFGEEQNYIVDQKSLVLEDKE